MRPVTKRMDFDIAIVGSGFGGSLLAMIARRLGRSVILLEKGQHPRFAIAESSTPLANLLLEEFALRYELPRLLPLAKSLMISSLRKLTVEYGLNRSPKFDARLRQATARVNAVQKVRPDMDSRDNASVFLSKPHVITFGTIFLAGLRSDEGMISVLAHELMHIADGDNDSLRLLVSAVGNKASDLTGLDIRGQRSEEVTCDLIGAMAARAYVANTPGYESITRRLARSIQHNCVEQDEGDDDHLSPRSTIRALLALNPVLVRELINDREERLPARKF